MPVIRAIFLSLIVHVILMIVLALTASDPNLRRDVTEIDIVSPPPPPQQSQKKQQQIVRDAFVPDKLKAQEDESLARFLSAQRQRVKKETQSANSGITQNREGKSRDVKEDQKATDAKTNQDQQQQQQQQKQAQNKKPGQRDLDKEGFKTWDPGGDMRAMNRASSTAGSRASAASTTGESLPTDVSVGSFTALNTDRFTYYTFYARVEELVRYRWESRIEAALAGLDRNTMIAMGNRPWVSGVEFLLTPDGHLKSALVMKESGVKKFDLAAINAFKEAAFFPNPPKELVEDDGMVHLKYSFTVHYNPSPFMGR